MGNRTKMTHFILLGIECPQTLKNILFLLFLLIYIVTVSANLMIIVLVLVKRNLQSPMYFFLSHLSLSDILLSTNVVPTMLCTLLRDGMMISVTSCITQYYCGGAFTISECFLLTVMSYDRYLAICNPLHYIYIMNIKFCLHLALWSWLFGFLITMILSIPLSFFEYCGCDVIDHIYCDFAPLIECSCSDTTLVKLEVTVFAILIVPFSFVFISVTYVSIFLTILKMSSTTGRKKALSTCSSHLTVVCTYYGALIAKYVVPPSRTSLNINKAISLLYTMVTPLFNPVIYSLRNQEIRTALKKCNSVKRLY